MQGEKGKSVKEGLKEGWNGMGIEGKKEKRIRKEKVDGKEYL